MPDHIHLLISLNKPDKFTNVIRDLKSSTSLWINKNNSAKSNFFWQDGYGSFSVSHSSLEKIKTYIRNQEEHHKTISFESEYEQLLKRHNIDFDHRFIFG